MEAPARQDLIEGMTAAETAGIIKKHERNPMTTTARPDTSRLPRSLEVLTRLWESLITGPDALKGETAKAARKLEAEAKPYEIGNEIRVTGPALMTENGQCLIWVNFKSKPFREQGEETAPNKVTVHPRIAAMADPGLTVNLIASAMTEADKNGHWPLVEVFAKTLVDAMKTLEDAKGGESFAQEIRRLRHGRLKTVYPDLDELLSSAQDDAIRRVSNMVHTAKAIDAISQANEQSNADAVHAAMTV